MSNFLGYWRTTLEEFYTWQGQNGNPAQGTVNAILGLQSGKPTIRYTSPRIHKDATCNLDSEGMPIAGSITGEQDIICLIDSGCPSEKIPSNLLTQEQFAALNWLPEE